MFLYIKGIYHLYLKTKFCFIIEPHSIEPQYNKYWQSCFNAAFSTPMNMRWLNFPFQPNINAETTLGHQHWSNVTLSTLFQRCFVNLETMSVNIRRLNFHFQPNFNGETTLVPQRWIAVILSTLFPRCFVNVETTSINVRRLNFHFQPNINVETTSMNGDDQHCFNVDSTLMCLLGELLIKKSLVKRQQLLRR